MLKHEENELICRVGPGTPMGNFMREYWVPAMLSSEVPSPDADPVRVKLLGEELIGFRETGGRVGLIQNHCPHRGASLFFGRNEEAGLRCVYHGWKFDVDGRCTDMPNEPAESDFKARVKAVAYPCQERGGIVWAYLGPRSTPPPLPDHEGNMQANAEQFVRATQLNTNWLQILEGDIDTSHVGFLHYGGLRAEDQIPGSFSEYQLREKTAEFEVIDTEGGAAYGARRPGPEGQIYWRIAQWCFPFYTFTPPGVLGTKKGGNARVPMDDYHTLTFSMVSGRNTPAQSNLVVRQPQLPNTTDWYGRFRPVPPRERFRDRSRGAAAEQRLGRVHRDQRHRHAGCGDDGLDGADLRPLAGAPRVDRRDGHPRAPSPDCGGQRAPAPRRDPARGRRPGGLPRPQRRPVPRPRRGLGREYP